MADQTAQIELLVPPEGTLYTPEDIATASVSSSTGLTAFTENNIGRLIDALGGPHFIPANNGVVCTPGSGMNVMVGGNGQWLIAQGRVLDTCPSTSLAIAAADASNPRIDAICVKASRVASSSQSVERLVRPDTAPIAGTIALFGTLLDGTVTIPLPPGYTAAPSVGGVSAIGTPNGNATVYCESVSTTEIVIMSTDGTDARTVDILVTGNPTGASGTNTAIPTYENQPSWLYVKGAAAANPVAPDAPTGYDVFCTVVVNANATMIAQANIATVFPQLPALAEHLILVTLQTTGGITAQGGFTVSGLAGGAALNFPSANGTTGINANPNFTAGTSGIPSSQFGVNNGAAYLLALDEDGNLGVVGRIFAPAGVIAGGGGLFFPGGSTTPLICQDSTAQTGINFVLPAAAPTEGYRFFCNGTQTLLVQIDANGNVRGNGFYGSGINIGHGGITAGFATFDQGGGLTTIQGQFGSSFETIITVPQVAFGQPGSGGNPLITNDSTPNPGLNFTTPGTPSAGFRFFMNGTQTLLAQISATSFTLEVPAIILPVNTSILANTGGGQFQAVLAPSTPNSVSGILGELINIANEQAFWVLGLDGDGNLGIRGSVSASALASEGAITGATLSISGGAGAIAATASALANIIRGDGQSVTVSQGNGYVQLSTTGYPLGSVVTSDGVLNGGNGNSGSPNATASINLPGGTGVWRVRCSATTGASANVNLTIAVAGGSTSSSLSEGGTVSGTNNGSNVTAIYRVSATGGEQVSFSIIASYEGGGTETSAAGIWEITAVRQS